MASAAAIKRVIDVKDGDAIRSECHLRWKSLTTVDRPSKYLKASEATSDYDNLPRIFERTCEC